MNYTPTEMAVFLRRCADGICDDSCPYWDTHSACDEALMSAAAEVLEEVPRMAEKPLTARQMADALRKCAHDELCDGCPYNGLSDCICQLKDDAAAMIEEELTCGGD